MKRQRTDEDMTQIQESKIEGKLSNYVESTSKNEMDNTSSKLEEASQKLRNAEQKIEESEQELKIAKQINDKERVKSLEIYIHDCMILAQNYQKMILAYSEDRNRLLSESQYSAG